MDAAPFFRGIMAKLTVNDIDLQGKRVLTRVDYNVPMAEQDGAMVINDDTRIRATLPTLKLMIESGAKVILTAHLGRPNGERVPSMSLRPVADKLAELIGQPVAFCDQCVGQAADDAIGQARERQACCFWKMFATTPRRKPMTRTFAKLNSPPTPTYL